MGALLLGVGQEGYEARVEQSLDRLARDDFGAVVVAWARQNVRYEMDASLISLAGYYEYKRVVAISPRALELEGWEFDNVVWHEIWHAVQFANCPTPVIRSLDDQRRSLRDPWMHYNSAIMSNYMSKSLRWDGPDYPHWFWQQDYFGELVGLSGQQWNWYTCELETAH